MMSRGQKLKDYIPGLEQSKQTTLVSRPGWLEAWSCEGWLEGEEHRVATFLVVYRSTRLKTTTAMYQPVADAILSADHVEVIRQGVHEDEDMIMGEGEIMFLRLYNKGDNPPYTVDEIRSIIEITLGEI